MEQNEHGVTAEIFQPIAVGRMSAAVVEQIRARIRSGKLAAGDRLPPERNLAAQLGVSRTIVREALRELQSAGLVDLPARANAGAVITRPTGKRIGERLGDMLLVDALQVADVSEARIVLELSLVEIVCKRASDEDLSALRAICDRSEAAVARGAYSVGLSTEFHLRLTGASHNRALELFVDSLRGVARDVFVDAGGYPPAAMGERVREHRAIVEAVASRDAVAVRGLLDPHLRRTASELRTALASRGSGA